MTRLRLAWSHLLLSVWVVCLPVVRAEEASAGNPTIHWRAVEGSPDQPLAEVANLPITALRTLAKTNWALPQWQRLFSVFAEQGSIVADVDIPPMVGDYRVIAGTLRFVPFFPLEPGINYRAVFRPDELPGGNSTNGTIVAARFRLSPPPARVPTVLSQIHPTSAVLPENLLKFYLEFSAPMRRGQIYDYIHLLDSSGRPVELPFLEINEELWNPIMTRLTLFLDPGRIKRGVRPLEETGPSLVVGQSYTLVIDHAWRDATGQPLQADFRKTFRVGPADRTPPDPAGWRFEVPPGNSREPLRIDLQEPLDHGILQRVLRIIDPAGHVVAGMATLADDDQHWSFVPDPLWLPGDYVLQIPTAIEDLAGNNIGKPFDLDLTDRPSESSTNRLVRMSFRIR